MTTPKNIIDRLSEDFSCSLKESKILNLINELEKKLSLEVIEARGFSVISLKEAKECKLPFETKRLISLSLNAQELKENRDYFIYEDNIIFSEKLSGNLLAEYVSEPVPYTERDFNKRPILICDGYSDIYIYYVLLSEAIMNDDIDRVNNFKSLYLDELKGLKEFYSKRIEEKFKNIW